VNQESPAAQTARLGLNQAQNGLDRHGGIDRCSAPAQYRQARLDRQGIGGGHHDRAFVRVAAGDRTGRCSG
jgi:hypothetical protein